MLVGKTAASQAMIRANLKIAREFLNSLFESD